MSVSKKTLVLAFLAALGEASKLGHATRMSQAAMEVLVMIVPDLAYASIMISFG